MSGNIVCVRTLTFDSGHRLKDHTGPCGVVHGHTYKVFLHASGIESSLDSVGRVIDFSVLKEKFWSWIQKNWDHGCLIFCDDHEAINALTSILKQKVFLMPYNPTAENIARYLLDSVGPTELQGTGVELVEVTVWETPNCYATVTK